MIIPKSKAPRLIRLASIPKMNIMLNVKSNANGIMDETTSAERKLPRISSTTKNTIIHPNKRFSNIVAVVFPISSLRSRIGLIYTPSGKVFCTSSTRAFTSLITCLEFAFLSIIICPNTFSPSPFAVMAPKRLAYP